VDKNPAYPAAIEALKAEGTIPERVALRQCGVEVWRGGLDAAYPLPALSSAGASLAHPAPFPHPAHRTGQAHFAHPALGERFTTSHTENCGAAQ